MIKVVDGRHYLGRQRRYGRTLSYVWTESGRLFNLDMIADGYAHEYTYDLPYRYQAGLQGRRERRPYPRTRAVVAERLRSVTRLRGKCPEKKEEHSEEDDHRRHRRRARRPVRCWGPGRPTPTFMQNCSEARAAGVTPIYEGDPGYAPQLDRDNDGIACE